MFVQDIFSGILEEGDKNHYVFSYLEGYLGPPVSLTMPIENRKYVFDHFPPFFEGLLPEGAQLDALLRIEKIDRSDYFSQLMTVGGELIGDVTASVMP